MAQKAIGASFLRVMGKTSGDQKVKSSTKRNTEQQFLIKPQHV